MVVNGVTTIDLPRCAQDSPLDAESDLPCFVAGEENRLAVFAVRRLLAGDGIATTASLFNPLVLIGPAGSGKSHLARGIARRAFQLHGEQAVAYFTAQDFGRELRAARDENLLVEFRQRLGKLSLLVVEDLLRLSPSDFIQRSLRDTIDGLLLAGGVVLVTSLQLPTTIPGLDAGLRDRLVNGLVVRLRSPGPQARQEILQQVTALRNYSLAAGELSNLAKRIDGSAPRLMCALAELELSSNTKQDIAASHNPPELKDIVAVVARYYSLTQAAIRSPARRKSLVYVRCIVVYLARTLTDLSYSQIGQGLGKRDHTTMMHAQRSIERELARDSATQHAVDDLLRILTTY